MRYFVGIDSSNNIKRVCELPGHEKYSDEVKDYAIAFFLDSHRDIVSAYENGKEISRSAASAKYSSILFAVELMILGDDAEDELASAFDDECVEEILGMSEDDDEFMSLCDEYSDEYDTLKHYS